VVADRVQGTGKEDGGRASIRRALARHLMESTIRRGVSPTTRSPRSRRSSPTRERRDSGLERAEGLEGESAAMPRRGSSRTGGWGKRLLVPDNRRRLAAAGPHRMFTARPEAILEGWRDPQSRRLLAREEREQPGVLRASRVIEEGCPSVRHRPHAIDTRSSASTTSFDRVRRTRAGTGDGRAGRREGQHAVTDGGHGT